MVWRAVRGAKLDYYRYKALLLFSNLESIRMIVYSPHYLEEFEIHCPYQSGPAVYNIVVGRLWFHTALALHGNASDSLIEAEIGRNPFPFSSFLPGAQICPKIDKILPRERDYSWCWPISRTLNEIWSHKNWHLNAVILTITAYEHLFTSFSTETIAI